MVIHHTPGWEFYRLAVPAVLLIMLGVVLVVADHWPWPKKTPKPPRPSILNTITPRRQS